MGIDLLEYESSSSRFECLFMVINGATRNLCGFGSGGMEVLTTDPRSITITYHPSGATCGRMFDSMRPDIAQLASPTKCLV